ncbi:MAG TPA: O-antigen ligase family protein [Candidatus Doudnabacteria bacterium]|nr:O-antigen ligase family protein [Candidatus Doudnabacteria bacterium]
MLYFYGLLFLFAPLYVWRFELAGLPTNFFMLYAIILAIGFGLYLVWQREIGEVWRAILTVPKFLRWSTGLFLLASVISLFVGGFDLAKFAQWLVLYVLPIKLAGQFYYLLKKEPNRKQVILNFLYLFLLGVGLVAIAQYFWLVGLPMDFWGNSEEPKRAIGYFTHPNGLALFITPLLAYLLPDFKQKIEILIDEIRGQNIGWSFVGTLGWIFGGVALLLSLSRGGWLGLLLAGLMFVIIAGGKKIRFTAFVVGLIITITVVAIPNLRYRVILPFYGEKSSVARLSLWETGTKMIKDSPILGHGIHGFNYNWEKFNTDPNLDHYNFPHNFILNTWVDLGLLGLLSWLLIVGWGLWYSRRNRGSPYALGLMLFLIALLAHGFIDIPYFKNDLAMVFWLIFALSI